VTVAATYAGGEVASEGRGGYWMIADNTSTVAWFQVRKNGGDHTFLLLFLYFFIVLCFPFIIKLIFIIVLWD